MKVAAIIQARMNSSRLPGKVLKQVMNKSLIEYQLERVSRSREINEIIIATTTNQIDESIVDICRKLDLPYYRGSEEDVLSRYYGAAVAFKADVIVRLTADCPVIDPHILDEIIRYYMQYRHHYDYVSNFIDRTYPRGMDTEVFSIDALHIAHHEAFLDYDREHVTPFLYRNAGRFTLGNFRNNENESRHRWTVDTIEDFQLVSNIIQTLYPVNPHFTLEDMLSLMREHEEWYEINAFVSQK
ncbi:cytidylyltransferase domain-containing protein [Paenibacillus eucommiae]|uniref:Spore coat polysaccharide biosynthesis protein SpsF n=1 Tax=Paenibacillus eucommiae TaxID=1355755 RepID=A0ABS4J5A5_9BACL|nr:glycosyltransferase family protein [Paenibacillus eucommiae]MBP1993974.1 spore coat polysaccharide biosynthesis protein SpsF [Paenibacillus eucommiae]